jgi:hypothetical protein
VGIDARLAFQSCSVDDAPTYIDSDDLNDSGLRESPEVGNVLVGGDTVHGGDYRQEPLMLLAAMMQWLAEAPVASGSLFSHRLPWQVNTDGKFLSFGKDLGLSPTNRARLYGSVKVGTRVITVESAGKLTEQFSYLGGYVDTTWDPVSLTYKVSPRNSGTKRMLQRQGSLMVNAQSAPALTSSEDVGVVSGTITCERSHGEAFGTGGFIEEPVAEDFASIVLSMSFFTITDKLHDLFREARDNKTPLKASYLFKHDEDMGGSEHRTRTFDFPKLICTECPEEIPGPGTIPYDVTLTAHPGNTIPDGMDGAEPMIETIVNEVSTQVMV